MTSKDTANARALWYVAPGRAEIRGESLPGCGPDEVRVRAFFGAISRGTEALVCAGRVPPGEYATMRAPFMGGNFPFPVKYGYATVGRAENGPHAGRHVFALYPHQTLFNVPAPAALPVPEGVLPQRAVLAANMETALNAMWDAAPGPSGRVAVIGAGVVGALVAFLCKREKKLDVTLVDVNPARAVLAKKLGLAFASPEAAPRDCETIFHASGHAAGLATAIGIAANEASIIEMSWYGEGTVPVPLGGAFHSRRLKLISSQVGQVAPLKRATVGHRLRLAMALDLLADPALDALIEPPVGFDELPEKLPALLAPGSGILCQRIDYAGAD